jgi:hypothetical protein
LFIPGSCPKGIACHSSILDKPKQRKDQGLNAPFSRYSQMTNRLPKAIAPLKRLAIDQI